MERRDRGASAPKTALNWDDQADDKFRYDGTNLVCASCIHDEALATYVDRHGSSDECNVCRSDRTAIALPLELLFDHLSGCIRVEYELDVGRRLPSRR